MDVVFVSGPYRGKTIYEVKLNIRRAERVAEWLWSKGYAVICPHTNSSFTDGLIPDPEILDAYITIALRCDLIAAMPGWEYSTGAVAECQAATDSGISVREVNASLRGWAK